MVVAKRVPDRNAPIINGLIALGSGGNGHDIGSSERSSVARERKGRPQSFPPREKLVRALDFSTGKLFFDMQIKANQRER